MHDITGLDTNPRGFCLFHTSVKRLSVVRLLPELPKLPKLEMGDGWTLCVTPVSWLKACCSTSHGSVPASVVAAAVAAVVRQVRLKPLRGQRQVSMAQ